MREWDEEISQWLARMKPAPEREAGIIREARERLDERYEALLSQDEAEQEAYRATLAALNEGRLFPPFWGEDGVGRQRREHYEYGVERRLCARLHRTGHRTWRRLSSGPRDAFYLVWGQRDGHWLLWRSRAHAPRGGVNGLLCPRKASQQS